MPTYADMVYHLGGVPVSSELPFISGNVYFVCSSGGSDEENAGDTVDLPLATIDQALAYSTLNDCIILLPGHAENLSATGIFDIDKAGVTIWGVGHYDRRPTFTYTAVTGALEVNAANCRVHNIKLVAGIKNVNRGVVVNAKGFQMTNVYMEENSNSSYNFDHYLETATTDNDVDGLSVLYCDFVAQPSTAAMSSGGLFISGAQNDVHIIGNNFNGWWTTTDGPINMGSTGAIYGLKIIGNTIANKQATGTDTGITVLSDNGHGIIARNYILNLANTTANVVGNAITVSSTGGILVAENYAAGIAGEAGVLCPPAFTTS